MYDISDGDEPYTVVSIHSECLLAHEFEECICTPEGLLFLVSNRALLAYPLPFISYLGTYSSC